MSIPVRVSILGQILLTTQVASCSPLPDLQQIQQTDGGFEESDSASYEPLPTELDDGDEDIITETATSTRQLAYAYSAQLALPNATITHVAEQHETRCRQAGPDVCQVLSSSVLERGPDHTLAKLELRAIKSWLTTFRKNLTREAGSKGGHLRALTTQAKNLSRVITNTAARLKTQYTLRERLHTLLALETDEVGNLLQIESELNRVQGEIERAESQLRQLREQVAMDHMKLQYEALPKAISSSATEPITDALNTFLSTLSQSVALLISFVAATFPWIMIGLPCLLLFVPLLKWMFIGRRPRRPMPVTKGPSPETYEDLTPEPTLD